MDNHLFTKAYSKIKQSENVLIVAHEKPDGDAVSSACAVAEFLTLINKKFTIFTADAPTSQFDYLPHVEKFINHIDRFDYDLIITLDCANRKRTALTTFIENKKSNQYIIEIDHHIQEDDYADLTIREDDAASTTQILYKFFKANKIKINKNIANCILTGIITDTANFFYPNTSPETINIASELMARGAKLPQIVEKTWRNKSLAAMKIWGKAMARLTINPKYNFATTFLTEEDLGKDVNDDDLEGISGFLSNLHDVKGLMLLREDKDGWIRGSLRTADPKINISKVAQILGGGGHIKAAGFKLKGKIKKTTDNWQVI